jgi:hypothetical protein
MKCMMEAEFSGLPRCTCPGVAWVGSKKLSLSGVVGKVLAWRSRNYQMEMDQSIRLDEEISSEFGAASVSWCTPDNTTI